MLPFSQEADTEISPLCSSLRWYLAIHTAAGAALCECYQGMPTESLFVLYGRREGFSTVIQMHFLLMLYNLLPTFESPGTFFCSLLTSSSYKAWLGERENRWRLSFPFWPYCFFPPGCPSSPPSLPYFSYSTKSNKWKTNQGNASQKNIPWHPLPSTHTKASLSDNHALVITTAIQQILKTQHNDHRKVWNAKLCYSVSSWQNSFNINRFDLWLEICFFFPFSFFVVVLFSSLSPFSYWKWIIFRALWCIDKWEQAYF